MVVATDSGPRFHVGLEWLAVGACLAIVGVATNLFLGYRRRLTIAIRRRAAGAA